MFNISIASVVTVDENGADAGIAPGQYIEHVKLNRTLSAGTYSATALFTAYDMENLLQAGQAAAKITIVAGS